ncbi:MAG: hypothetical protein FWG89_10370 [Treponema sp.]|nr:hypothetical protein [Treponema sp.]
MTDSLGKAAEEWFGIKADPDNVEKLRAYIVKTYGGETPAILAKVFSSGEAAGILTVNETYFFREPAHFSFLRDNLPLYENTGIRICCAAVSTGCEAYSIAMLIESYNKRRAAGERPLTYHIDAFDINPTVIETAVKGTYGERALRDDGDCFHYAAVPYLQKLEYGYLIDTSLQKNINFFTHNLMDKLPSNEYNFIFFRNAFIYFSVQNRERVLFNVSAALKKGGILIMGVSETAGVSHPNLDNKNNADIFYFIKK